MENEPRGHGLRHIALRRRGRAARGHFGCFGGRYSAIGNCGRYVARKRLSTRAAPCQSSWLLVSAKVSDATIRSRPVFLASYIAMSARRTMLSMASPLSHSATPKLHVTVNV